MVCYGISIFARESRHLWADSDKVGEVVSFCPDDHASSQRHGSVWSRNTVCCMESEDQDHIMK